MNNADQGRLIEFTQAEYEAMAWSLDLAANHDFLRYIHPNDADNVKALAERFKY